MIKGSFFDPSQEADAKRRRRLAAAAIQQSQQGSNGTEVISGMAVKRSPIESLARALQGGIGAYQENRADQIDAEAAKRRQEMIAQAVKQYGSNPQGTAEMLAQDPATSDAALKILSDIPAHGSIFSGNSIQAQIGNQMKAQGYSDLQILQALTMQGIPLQDGGYGVYSKVDRVGAPGGVPSGTPSPNPAPVQTSELPASGGAPFNDIMASLQGKPTGISGEAPASAPVPNPPTPQQMADQAQSRFGGVDVLVQPQPKPPAGTMIDPDTGEIVSSAVARPMPQAAIENQNSLIDQIQGLRQAQTAANNALAQIESGKLDLGLVNNAIATARNYAGIGDEETANLAAFKSNLETMRNSILLLHKGVQTEGDAQRAMNQIVSNINSPEVVRTQLQRLNELNRQAEQIKQFQLQRSTENFGRQMPEIPQMAAAPQNVQTQPASIADLLQYMTPEERALFQ